MTKAMDRRVMWKIGLVSAIAACLLGAGLHLLSPRVPRTTGPPPQGAYVWQREWTPAVQQAVHEHASNLKEIIALAAEVTWRNGQPQVTRINLDFGALQAAGAPIGLALRIGSFSGPFASHSPITDTLAAIAWDLVQQAQDAHLSPRELQIDFDCPESKLSGYRLWLDAIRRKVQIPVTITALPSWLNHREFARLVDPADGYVLQVHSLERPKAPDAATTLCDPAAASRAVEWAARLRRPFRVALPTYGYRIAFDHQQRFLGISAEGPAPTWPGDAIIREVRAEPNALASLIQKWTADRPIYLQGILWYRLPTADDTMNWQWRTLTAVMKGQTAEPDLRVEVRRPEPNLAEIDLVNAGQADAPLQVAVELRWAEAKLVAADAIGGFGQADAADDHLQLQGPRLLAHERLGPGQRRMIGWVRLSKDMEVQAHVRP